MISQLESTTCLTSGVTSTVLPPIEDVLVTGAGVALPTQATETIPSGRITRGMGTEGWTEMSTIMMEFTDPLELKEDDPLQTDRYMAAYPDFHSPSYRHPRISEVF